MLKRVIEQLAEVEVSAVDEADSSSAGADGVLTLTVDDWIYRFAYQSCARAPYPNELDGLSRLHGALAAAGLPLLIAPYISRALAKRLSRRGWSWADHAGNFDLRGPDLRLSHTGESRVVPARSSMPRGSAASCLIRALISYPPPAEGWWTTARLAALSGLAASAVSQVLSRLLALELVEHPRHGRWRARAKPLLHTFQREHRGFRGSEQAWYVLDSLDEVAARLSKTFAGKVALSADLAPDRLAPWRVPSKLIVYARRALDQEELASALDGVSAKGRADGNVFIRVPRDRGVFLSDLSRLGVELELPIADPVQQLFDLLDLGGSDREEAGRVLEQWILQRHER